MRISRDLVFNWSALCVAFSLCLLLILGRCLEAQDSTQAIGSQAEEMEREGRWEEAARAYLQILSLDPHSIAALNHLGALYVRRNRFAQGIDYYARALTVAPDDYGTNLNLGIAYFKNQDYQHAISPLRQANRVRPSNTQVLRLLSLCFIAIEDNSQAILTLEKIAAMDPRDAGTLYLLSRAYLQTKEYHKALATFDQLTVVDPESPWVHVLKGQAYEGLTEYETAIKEFTSAKRQQPQDATVHFSLGFIYWKVQRLTEAEEELSRAIELDPTFSEAQFYLADAYLTDMKPESAIPILRSLLAKNSDQLRARLDLGKALVATEQYAEAAQEFEEAIRRDPARAEAHYQLARVYRELKQPTKVQLELQIAKTLLNDKVQSEQNLTEATGERGDAAKQLGFSFKQAFPDTSNVPK